MRVDDVAGNICQGPAAVAVSVGRAVQVAVLLALALSLLVVVASLRAAPLPKGLHSSTFLLNLSAVYGIGGARRGHVARVQGSLGVG
jgi:hypothetical protein